VCVVCVLVIYVGLCVEYVCFLYSVHILPAYVCCVCV